MSADEKFHAHLDECIQCREECFNLCPVGDALLVAVAQALPEEPMFRGLQQWNQVLRNARTE